MGVQKQLSTANNAPQLFANTLIAVMSATSVSGLEGVSKKNNFVFGRIAACQALTSVAETKVVSTPNFFSTVLNRFTVEPKML
jgi:hypothetical protein